MMVSVGLGAGFPFTLPSKPTIDNPFKNPLDPKNATDITAIIGTVGDLVKVLENLTPEQEYYLGRAVGANIVSKYGAFKNDAANHYVRLVGQTLAQASDKPETYAGYHFLILDSEEVNAFAAPSGFIFVTRGMLQLCQSEDDLAAVLAHEIGHVQLNHAVKAIKEQRATKAIKGAAGNVVQFRYGIDEVTTQLITSKYSQDQEKEADAMAMKIVAQAGYDSGGLVRLLEAMKERSNKLKNKTGFYKSHPDHDQRIRALEARFKVAKSPPQPVSEPRQARYQAALAKL